MTPASGLGPVRNSLYLASEKARPPLRTGFDRYIDQLSIALGHADRVAGLRGYCTGLMLPLERKSVEPMAAGVDPEHASARHQALHHFVAKADWSDAALMRAVAEAVLPAMDLDDAVWIIDDTGIPKKGIHSVGVARQYCGQLGKQDNCQVAVSLSLATEQASLPMAYRLYLPKVWVEDRARRRKTGVPAELGFATKTEIAVELKGRFAAVRVRHAGGNAGRARLRPEEWLLIEWPPGEAEPAKYYLSTLAPDTPLNELVAMAHRRWRIERDYQDLKQEFGLDHYEGRGWRGLSLSGFLCDRAILSPGGNVWRSRRNW